HNAHVLWAFTTNQKTNPLAFSYVELTFFYIKIRLLRADLFGMILNSSSLLKTFLAPIFRSQYRFSWLLLPLRFFSLRPAPVQAEAFFHFCRCPLRARIGEIAVVSLAQLILAGCKRKTAHRTTEKAVQWTAHIEIMETFLGEESE
ncbi:hypothetical protein, partial [Porphyromonas gingivalis]|uniref:hypothetical protein n=1 Tax=Porphyromonas gingivalis TaxID=837 RepID=UPI001C4E21FD